MKQSSQSMSSIRRRAGWLLALLVVTGAMAYPEPANWLIWQAERVSGVTLPRIQLPFVLGLDLQGGTSLEYEADVSKIPEAERREALNGVRDVIERRVNAMGVAEPLIQTTQAGDAWRVNVELAGVRDITQAIKRIGETPILEFKTENTSTQPELTEAQKKLLADTNAARKKQADAFLVEAQKPGADLQALAKQANTSTVTTTNLGFVQGNPAYSAIAAEARGKSAGTILGKVFDEEPAYVVAKVDEVRDDKEVQASHILISWQGIEGIGSTLTKEDARKKIEELKKQVTPANFADIAAKESQEPGASASKGDLGYFGKGQMVDAFENAVFPMASGTISDIVETQFGYHLIHKTGERMTPNQKVSVLAVLKLTANDIAPPPEPYVATRLTGQHLQSARLEFNPQTGFPYVALEFNEEGAKLFEEITRDNINRQIAIFLDGNVISNPVVNQVIMGGRATIEGRFTVEEAKLLARRLQAGALPVPVKLIAQQTVGPTLGTDSVQQSLMAGLIGFALVAVFMIVVYRLPGLVSVLALALYAAVSSAVFKTVPVTLSLAGIAGFILSIGIAVDANILTFERLKEELEDQKKSLANALEEAFRRSWLSIRDGHMTVLISCAVLYWFSSSIIRGFALTLAIGTLLSLFTAVVSTRTMLRFLVRTSVANKGWLFLKK